MLLTPVQMGAEIERLRALLEDHGIDPDPPLLEPEYFGAPTREIWLLQRMFAASAREVIEQQIDWLTDRDFACGGQSPAPAATLRVRVPAKFTVETA